MAVFSHFPYRYSWEKCYGNPDKNVARLRIPDPALLDSTLLYLVGPASEAVTGAVIRVDDGQSARTTSR